VYVEEGSVLGVDRSGRMLHEIGRGTIFFGEDVDLTDCDVVVDGKRYKVVDVRRYVKPGGAFHHLEVVYR